MFGVCICVNSKNLFKEVKNFVKECSEDEYGTYFKPKEFIGETKNDDYEETLLKMLEYGFVFVENDDITKDILNRHRIKNIIIQKPTVMDREVGRPYYEINNCLEDEFIDILAECYTEDVSINNIKLTITNNKMMIDNIGDMTDEIGYHYNLCRELKIYKMLKERINEMENIIVFDPCF